MDPMVGGQLRFLLVGCRGNDQAVQIFERPVVLDEFQRQPVQQAGMCRAGTPHAKIIWRANQSLSKVPMPDPIADHASCLPPGPGSGIRHPECQLKAATLVVRDRVVFQTRLVRLVNGR